MMVSMSSMNKYVVTIKLGNALSTMEARFEKTCIWEASTPNAIRAGTTGIPIKNANMITPETHRATEFLCVVGAEYSLSVFARYITGSDVLVVYLGPFAPNELKTITFK